MSEEEMWKAFKETWANFPSQDNEGYVPHRGDYKCGFFAAWMHQQKKISPKSFISSVTGKEYDLCDHPWCEGRELLEDTGELK